VSRFQNEEHSILCSTSMWEGLDIPGPSLSNLILFSLPFPPVDPIFSAKRKGADDPFAEVDLPFMLLRLRQGLGRLIRTATDKGIAHIIIDQAISPSTKERILAVLPSKIQI